MAKSKKSDLLFSVYSEEVQASCRFAGDYTERVTSGGFVEQPS